MVKRDKLIHFINKTIGKELFEKAKAKDDFANGVQILGSEEVKVVALGVSVNEEFLTKAVKNSSNFCIFHHGLSPFTYKARFSIPSQKRMRLIYKNDMSVMGLHYVLDAHPKIGNNSVIINKLGAILGESFTDEWGYTATFASSQEVHELAHKCNELFDHEVFAVANGPKKVRKIGVCSGAHRPTLEDFVEMEELGIELLITGETAEYLSHQMKEAEINYFVCGHYATEVFGIKALGDKIVKHFGKQLQVKFIDVPNPI